MVGKERALGAGGGGNCRSGMNGLYIFIYILRSIALNKVTSSWKIAVCYMLVSLGFLSQDLGEKNIF